MKFSIEKHILEKLLINTQAYIEKKDLSQITSHIYIEAKEDTITLKATDYEIGIQIHTKDVDIQKQGEGTANGKKILDIVKNLQQDTLVIYTQQDTLIIEQKTAQFKIPMYATSEFPPFPKIPKKSVELSQANFIQSLKKALPSVESNNPRYELNGILIKLADSYYDIVSTDTKRLAIIQQEESIKETQELIVPKRSIVELQKIIQPDSGFFFDNTHFIIKNDNIYFFTKLINAQYPPYEKIVPQNIQHTITLQKKEILNAIQMISSLSETVTISFEKDTIRCSTSLEAQSKAKVEVKANTNLENFTININSRFLIDFLHCVEEEDFTLELNEEQLPFIASSKNFKTIIMPVINQ